MKCAAGFLRFQRVAENPNPKTQPPETNLINLPSREIKCPARWRRYRAESDFRMHRLHESPITGKKYPAKAVRRDAPVLCETCGRSVERRARQQRHCSERCRERGRKRSRKSFLGPDTAAPRNPNKSTSKNNELQKPKIGSSLFANAPLNLLGGGSWRWPAPHIYNQTWSKIVRAEIGAVVVPSNDGAAA